MRQIGIFTQMYGDAAEPTYPLPIREEGVYGLGRGRAAGHSVQLDDWAYLKELAEQRRHQTNDNVRSRWYFYPMRFAGQTRYSVDGAWTAIGNYGKPSRQVLQDVRGVTGGQWFVDPDAAPATSGAEFSGWPTSFLYQPSLRALSSAAGQENIRSVHDLRCAFYDLKKASRVRSNYAGVAYRSPDTGNYGGSRPSVKYVYSSQLAQWVRSDVERDKVKFTASAMPPLLGVASEVVAHSEFASAPAYAVLYKTARRLVGSVPQETWTRYVCMPFTLSQGGGEITATIDLAEAGCDCAGICNFMQRMAGTFDTASDYDGWAGGMDLVFDVNFPYTSTLFGSWTWTPDAA